MPTKLFFKEEYLTPDELLELLTNHFEQMPTDLLFRPQIDFISCDKNLNETVIVNEASKRILDGLQLTKEQKIYHKNIQTKTIIRDKSKAN
ncbi:hypothetical protein NBRC116494_17850 [Aurantivibrio plasticivorans]